MGHNNSSLAFDEAVKEVDSKYIDYLFEPELTVLVNPHYAKNLGMQTASHKDVVQVSGSITVSF